MNQILAVEMPSEKDKKKKPKKKKQKKAETKSVIVFFCILLLILGIAIIVIVARTYLSSGGEEPTTDNTTNSDTTVSIPEIEIITGTTSLDITITSDYEIDYIIYSWDDGEETQVNGDEEYEMELTLTIPDGTSTLTITAKDINGGEKTYTNEYTNTGEEYEPTITLEQEDNTINITIESETILDYVSYTFDDETETIEGIDDTIVEIPIKITSGEHSLSITVVDENGETYEETKSFSIPTITLLKDATACEFVVSISSTTNITEVNVILNGEEQDVITVNDTEYETTFSWDEDLDVNWILVEVNTENGSYTKGTAEPYSTTIIEEIMESIS